MQRYCEFGGFVGLREMDSAKFAKLARDCGFVDRRLTPADVDLIFTMSKTKGLRRLHYEQFVDALNRIGVYVCVAVAVRSFVPTAHTLLDRTSA